MDRRSLFLAFTAMTCAFPSLLVVSRLPFLPTGRGWLFVLALAIFLNIVGAVGAWLVARGTAAAAREPKRYRGLRDMALFILACGALVGLGLRAEAEGTRLLAYVGGLGLLVITTIVSCALCVAFAMKREAWAGEG